VVRLQVVQVECLLARSQDARDGGTVAHSETDLHIDALCCSPVHIRGEQPVVLAGLEHVAHLVCTDGVEVLVVAADLLPLWMEGDLGSDGVEVVDVVDM